MPLLAGDTELKFIGDGTRTLWTLPCRVDFASDFEATLNGVVTTAYTLSGLGATTLQVEFSSPPGNGVVGVIARVVPYSRELYDYQLGEFSPDTIDSDIERVIEMAQQLRTMLKRVPILARGYTDLGMTLTPEAGKLLAWAGDALSLVNVAASTITPSSLVFTAIGQALAVAATQAAGRTAIAAMGQADVDATIAATPMFTFRNKVINGSMRIDQENEGAAVALTTTSRFGLDRWAVRSNIAAAGTITAQRQLTGSTGVSRHCLRLARTAGTYAGSLLAEQVFETDNVLDLAGQGCYIVLQARKGVSFTGAGLRIQVFSGTGIDESLASFQAGTWTGLNTMVDVLTSAASMGFSFGQIAAQFTPNSTATQIGIRISADTFSGGGGANDYLEFTDVQVIRASAPLQFERRPLEIEQALCERYCEKSYSEGVALGTVTTLGAIYAHSPSAVSPIPAMAARFRTKKRNGNSTVTWYSTATGASGNIRNITDAVDAASGVSTTMTDGSTGYPTTVGGIAKTYAGHWFARNEL